MAESTAPWAVLSHDGCVHVDVPLVAVLLIANPRGAYTTTRSGNDGECLLLWNRHMKRLAQSMEILSVARRDHFPRPLRNFSGLEDLVRPPLQIQLTMAGWTPTIRKRIRAHFRESVPPMAAT